MDRWINEAKETLARLPSVLQQLHSPECGWKDGERISDWCRAQLRCPGLSGPPWCASADNPSGQQPPPPRSPALARRHWAPFTGNATWPELRKLRLPSQVLSLQAAVDACAHTPAGHGGGEGNRADEEVGLLPSMLCDMLEVCGDLAWSAEQGAEMTIGGLPSQAAHQAAQVAGTQEAQKDGGGRVVRIVGVVNETRALLVPRLDSGGVPRMQVARAAGGGKKGRQAMGRGDTEVHMEQVVGARSLREQEELAVFHDGFHFDDDPPGVDQGFEHAEWGCEASWRSLPSLHTVTKPHFLAPSVCGTLGLETSIRTGDIY